MRGDSGNSSRRAIAVLCVAQFMVVLDVTIVITALPAMGRALGFTPPGLQWVITAYTLCFGGCLLAGGRLADVLGARRAFAAGLAAFTVTSLLCALAPTATLLVAFRAGQGLAAALLSPAALALLAASAAPGEEQRRAVGAWTAVAAGGGATGWVLGGLLAEYADWRWVFGVNVPLGLAALALVPRVLPRDAGRGGARLDAVGAVGVTLGLAAAVYGLTEATAIANDPLRPLVPLLAGAATVYAVLRRERRLADPLLPAGLLTGRGVRGASLVAAVVTASTSPAMYLAVLYVQDVIRLAPGRAALYFPALNLTVIAGSVLGPRLLAVAGGRWLAAGGFTLITGGCLVLTTLPAAGEPAVRLLSSFALMGIGLGLASVASTAVGTALPAPEHRGVAAGLLTSAAQIGTAVGLAVVAPLAAATSGSPTGLRWGFVGSAVIAVLGLVAAWLLPRRTAEASQDRDGRSAPATQGS
jgi:MFS family permease